LGCSPAGSFAAAGLVQEGVGVGSARAGVVWIEARLSRRRIHDVVRVGLVVGLPAGLRRRAETRLATSRNVAYDGAGRGHRSALGDEVVTRFEAI
jgi:hypothetical protein